MTTCKMAKQNRIQWERYYQRLVWQQSGLLLCIHSPTVSFPLVFTSSRFTAVFLYSFSRRYPPQLLLPIRYLFLYVSGSFLLLLNLTFNEISQTYGKMRKTLSFVFISSFYLHSKETTFSRNLFLVLFTFARRE